MNYEEEEKKVTTTTTTTTTTATTRGTTTKETTTIPINFINNTTSLKTDKHVIFFAFVFTMLFHFN